MSRKKVGGRGWVSGMHIGSNHIMHVTRHGMIQLLGFFTWYTQAFLCFPAFSCETLEGLGMKLRLLAGIKEII